jgi:hypothetical protein
MRDTKITLVFIYFTIEASVHNPVKIFLKFSAKTWLVIFTPTELFVSYENLML